MARYELHILMSDKEIALVIELPYRRAVYVIDTGGTVLFGEDTWKTPDNHFEVGRKIVVPYLKGRGISKLIN